MAPTITLPGWAAEISDPEYLDAVETASNMQSMSIKATWDHGNAWRLFNRRLDGTWCDEDRYGMLSQQHVNVVVSGRSYFPPPEGSHYGSSEEFDKRIPMAICFWDWHDDEEEVA